jgi:hypothetical protein
MDSQLPEFVSFEITEGSGYLYGHWFLTDIKIKIKKDNTKYDYKLEFQSDLIQVTYSYSNHGYYMSTFDINNKIIPTCIENNINIYLYTFLNNLKAAYVTGSDPNIVYITGKNDFLNKWCIELFTGKNIDNKNSVTITYTQNSTGSDCLSQTSGRLSSGTGAGAGIDLIGGLMMFGGKKSKKRNKSRKNRKSKSRKNRKSKSRKNRKSKSRKNRKSK